MLRKIIILLLTLSLVISVSGCNKQASQRQTKETIKIGVLSPLTGDAATWGQTTKRGTDLALDDLKKEGKGFELIYEDSKCEPKTGLTAIKKLINQDGVNIILGTICSSVVLAGADIINENQIVLLSPGATSPEITKAGDYVFRNWPSDAYEGMVIAKFAYQDLNLQSASILYLNNDYGLGLKNIFTKIFEGGGGKIINTESFKLNAKDFKTQLTKVRANNSECIFIATNPNEAPLILNQINELDFDKNKFIVLMNGPAVESEEIKTNPYLAEGVFYAMSGWKNPDWFLESYKAKYNSDYEIPADTAYDSLMLISKTIDQCGKIDSTCIKDELYKIKDYMGAAGLTTFDENGDVVDKEFVIKTVRNGEFVEYGKSD